MGTAVVFTVVMGTAVVFIVVLLLTSGAVETKFDVFLLSSVVYIGPDTVAVGDVVVKALVVVVSILVSLNREILMLPTICKFFM